MQRALSLLPLLAFASVLGAEPAKMQTREFKVDFDLRAMGRSQAIPPQAVDTSADPFAARPETAPAAGTDPFASPDHSIQPEKPPPIPTSKDVLSKMGISFPPGATSFYDSGTSTLRVHNTPEMLDVIEAFVKSGVQDVPRDLVCSLTVIEGPGEIIRQTNGAAAHKANASAELRKLLDQAKQPDSKLRVVNDAWLQIQSGTRATSTAAEEHIHTTGLSLDSQGHASLNQEMRPLGLKFELEPTLSADRITIETTLSLQLTLAPPELRPVSISDPGTGNMAEYSTTHFFQAEFATAISSASGTTKLIGVASPPGKSEAPGDRLWAVFLTTTIHLQEAVQVDPPQPPVLRKNAPKVLQAAALRVPEGLLYDFGWPELSLPEWLEAKGIPAVKGASVVQQNGVLQIIHTPDNIERISVLADEALEKAPKSIACTLHTVQAPAAFLRDLAHASAAASDHAGMWAQVEAAVARGEGRFINSLFLETPSEKRAKHISGSEYMFVEEFGLDSKGRPMPGIAYRNVGSTFEFEPTLHAEGRTLKVVLSYELNPAPPAQRREPFRDPASALRFDRPISDIHSIKTVSSLVMAAGGTRLLSLHRPTGRDADGMLWATFLKIDVVTQLKPPTDRQPPPSVFVRPDPQSWHTRSFKVPPDFLPSAGNLLDAPPAGKPNGHAPPTAKSVLEAAGITFPEGATVVFDPLHALLIVRSTQASLDLVEAYVEWSCRPWPSTVAYTAQIFQGPGPLLRQLTAQAAGKCDHRAELDALLAAVKAGTVQALNTARIETKRGTQATATQAREHTSLCAVKVNDKGETEFDQDIRQVGLTLSIEPAYRADGRTIESTLYLEFHPAEPLVHREHITDSQGRSLELPLTDYQVVHLATGPLIPSGAARLAGLWKPKGKPEFEQEDILQMLILTCDQLWVEP